MTAVGWFLLGWAVGATVMGLAGLVVVSRMALRVVEWPDPDDGEPVVEPQLRAVA